MKWKYVTSEAWVKLMLILEQLLQKGDLFLTVSNSPLQSLKNFCEKQKSEKLMSVSVACYF